MGMFGADSGYLSVRSGEKEHFIHKMLDGNKIFFIKKINQIRENTLQNNVLQVK